MKLKHKKEREIQKGITLIALVITIIVLLILAGVSIATLTGDNGILTKAQTAKTETEKASEKEQIKLAAMNAAMNTERYNYKVEDGTVPIPAGFAPTQIEGENTVADGLVVVDSSGSEFVWVPVSDINIMSQCSTAGGNCKLILNEDGHLSCETHSNNTEIVGKLWATNIEEGFENENKNYNSESGLREPAYLSASTADASPNNNIGLTLKEMQDSYKSMAESVAKYRGFYVGRYETSLSDATENSVGTSRIVQSKSGVIPTSINNSATSSWYGLYKAHKEGYVINTNSVVSSMIWGSQYDAILNWVKNAKSPDFSKITDNSIGNHKKSISTTGNKEYSNDIINNIKDLGGNLFEFTLEAYNTYYRISRGGAFTNSYPISNRNKLDPFVTYGDNGSRLTLYIK